MRCSMDKFIDELTMASYGSEMDLDRDVPSNEEFQEFKDCGGMDGFPHGPDSVEASKWFDEDDFDFDAYCEANPDFNAAMNGHPEYI